MLFRSRMHGAGPTHRRPPGVNSGEKSGASSGYNSAHEILRAHVDARTPQAEPEVAGTPKIPRIPGVAKQPVEAAGGGGIGGMLNEALFGRTGPRGGQYDGLVQTMAKTAARSVASGIGRQIVRGVLGGLLGGKR